MLIKWWLIFFGISLAFANDSPLKKSGGPPDGLSVGIGSFYQRQAYSGLSPKLTTVPIITLKLGRFFWRGPTISYDILNTENTTVAGLVNANFFNGYDAEDSTDLAGMANRKGTLSLGLSFKQKLGFIDASFSFANDVLGTHSGFESTFNLGTDFPISILIKGMPFTIMGTGVGLNFYDKEYIDYYFGVGPDETTASRNQFSGANAYNPQWNAFIMTKFTSKLSFRVSYRWEWLDQSIRSSPIVSRNKSSMVMVFLTYLFPL